MFLTDNRVLADKHRELPALMCAQRKATKKVVTEEDAIQANIDSFGNEIGKITNRVTSMFEVQSRYDPESEEYKILDYRINSGQLFQQNAIDKAKGIVAKPMPKSWYDWRSAAMIEDPEQRKLYLDILADKKPYFMRYIYPNLMRDYNRYIKRAQYKSGFIIGKTIEEIEATPEEERDDVEIAFLEFFYKRMPVGIGDCVINRICRKFESEFDSHLKMHRASHGFDYTVMKSGIEYSEQQYEGIRKLLAEYNRRVQNYAAFADRERVDDDEANIMYSVMHDEFVRSCENICQNSEVLCDVMLDACYRSNSTKRFVWDICGEQIIRNLLKRSNNMICYPIADMAGDVTSGGRTFRFEQIKIGGQEYDCA